MKYCPNCGEKLDGDSNFCDNCGNQVSDNINDKPNSNNSRKSISDILNPILERPKLLLLIIIVLIFIMGISFIFNSNSDSNTFAGQEITLDGVNFHIPEGFTYYSHPDTSKEQESLFALYSDDGKQPLEFIRIKVSDITPYRSAEKLSANTKLTINGKECYLYCFGESDVYCAYNSNDKLVQLSVPYSYEYNNEVISYKELLAVIIE